jgi:hypothetical protein
MTDSLLTELGALLRRTDPVPPPVIAAAESALALAAVPLGWILLDQLPEPALIRSAAHFLRFQDSTFSVQIELRDTRLSGLVCPLSDVEVRWPNGSVLARPDTAGFFRVGDLPRGPLRLVIDNRVTRWFSP